MRWVAAGRAEEDDRAEGSDANFRDWRHTQYALWGSENTESGNRGGKWKNDLYTGNQQLELRNEASNSFYNCLDSRSSAAQGQCLQRRSAGLQKEDRGQGEGEEKVR